MIQSHRKDAHLLVADTLLAEGKAYRCFCNPAELRERLGESALHEGGYAHYDGKCRDRVVADADKDKPYALRFKLPADRATIAFDDLIRGQIVFERDQLDDFIIVRSDRNSDVQFCGSCRMMFLFENFSCPCGVKIIFQNTPKQILLYESDGLYRYLQFAHFSIDIGCLCGQRLSKRAWS